MNNLCYKFVRDSNYEAINYKTLNFFNIKLTQMLFWILKFEKLYLNYYGCMGNHDFELFTIF